MSQQAAVPATPPPSTAQKSKAGRLVIALTLALLAVPCVIGVVRISGTIPSFNPPDLFPPWYSLGAVIAILIVWVNYASWCRPKAGSRNR